MLVYNDYLKKIGVKKSEFPFHAPHSTQIDREKGVRPCQLWNLDYTLAMEIYTYISAFMDDTGCYPAYMEGKEEWDEILNEIKIGLEDYIKSRTFEYDKDEFARARKGLDRSLDLLKEYWEDLWY